MHLPTACGCACCASISAFKPRQILPSLEGTLRRFKGTEDGRACAGSLRWSPDVILIAVHSFTDRRGAKWNHRLV